MQRLRHRLQERARRALGASAAGASSPSTTASRASARLDGLHALHGCALRRVCPVDCFYTTADAVVLHSKDLCIGCGYCFYACPFGAPQYPRVGNFGSRGKMDKCTFCTAGPEPDSTEVEYVKYGSTAWPKASCRSAPRCARPSRSCRRRRDPGADLQGAVTQRGYGSGAWGWQTAYRETVTV
jgi:formate dehydrogenase iron-sulfur subunit